jgi:basic amino acid/polyamine antiporter, APA family
MSDQRTLRRRLGLPLLVLYGTGVTVGAGIYVLVGSVAGHAGKQAPLAFVIAAVVMGLTVASYAELCTRFPVAAGDAAYVKGAFGSRLLSTLTGLAVIVTAVIASATVTLGAAGYIAQFTDLPRPLVVSLVVITLGLVSAWGILESVILASVFTVVELSGLIIIIVAAAQAGTPIADTLLTLPAFTTAAWAGIGFASLLAFFAFIGFEDLTNIVEEAHQPERNIPLAMVLTLIITTVLYVVIAAIAVTAVPPERLAGSTAPLSLVFRELSDLSPATIAAIAIVATLNTIIAEITMATRVIYGMAALGDFPRALGAVSGATATPLVATAMIVAAVLALALLAPMERLAESTSLATLVVFAIVNLALLKLRWDGAPAAPGVIRIPVWVPVLGLITCLAMIAVSTI